MSYLITGCAGFIGAKVALILLQQGEAVYGVDNLNDYYDVQLKLARLEYLKKFPNFHFYPFDIADFSKLNLLFIEQSIKRVIHLAAQAGVRYSLENPQSYVQSNLVGFVNLLECCRQFPVEHLVFASSSSVYGANTHYPYYEKDRTDHPVSLYAATKKSNEVLAHAYSSQHNIPITGLRYFTVYGPWGRPDMAPILFAKAIQARQAIPVHNYGHHQRDFTFIDDIATGTIQAAQTIALSNSAWDSANPETCTSSAPFRIFNIGYGRPIELMDFIALLENALGKKAIIDFKPKQVGDVDITFSNTTLLQEYVGYKPRIPLEEGIEHFVRWFKEYYF